MSPRATDSNEKGYADNIVEPAKYRDMLNFFKNGLVCTEIDREMRKKTYK